MMYKSEAAIAVKVDGKVVREITPGAVKIPFGSEYSVYFKNLSDRSCVVKVTIDGEDVLRGSKLIVRKNESVDLERYLDSMSKGNKLKFAKMTDAVAENRGVKAEDGVIRVEWQFERKVEVVKPWWETIRIGEVKGWPQQTWTDGGVYNYQNTYSNNTRSLVGSNATLNSVAVGAAAGASYSAMSCDAVASASCGEVKTSGTLSAAPQWGEAGFTTKGDVSSQKFQYGSIGALEAETHSVCIYMTGCDEPVITTKDKIKCDICGTQNKFGSKFCHECGTYIAKI